ncbi:MAG: 2-C-methyl-D-erythritol 4-phosphate cytidylyltransferase [Candidatus Contendobacter odensis]|uniref:2-C-methyl-D-erythritol 4-phosphate cytidylyltransferase n=1 Tax=Candidatus Contendibacter odensensis TaxID=1400860 RepID=A0A2G6PDU2_9GAMM|nr:MAG: 2-C-methyl-D-erythritol 4-phosphate cytidylyltransferase [Candidatus Contendobacter odensis]
MPTTHYWALVPAAGVGNRMASTIPKQYLPLAGEPVIVHTLRTLLSHSHISGLAVVVSAEDEWWSSVTAHLKTAKPLWTVIGGAERCHSVLNGLAALRAHADHNDWVLVHDAARPCLTQDDLDRLFFELMDDPVGGLLAVPVRDTLKRAENTQRIKITVDRSQLWHALTPQMFQLGRLYDALQAAIDRGLLVTDEAAAMEIAGWAPRLIEGRATNMKITRPEDLALAEFYLTRNK